MKSWLIHIIYIGLLGLLATSCSNYLEETSSEQGDKVSVTFTLAMGEPSSRSRASFDENESDPGADIGNSFENKIDGKGLQVLLYSADGKNTCLGKVENISVFSTDNESVYRFVGDLSIDKANIINQALSCKIMVFANCPNVENGTNLSGLLYDYNAEAFRNGTQYIPMWGVKTSRFTLTPGSRTDLGTIYLLRAMAKVKVTLDPSIAGNFNLDKVNLTNYGTKGYCLPFGYNTAGATESIETEKAFRPLERNYTKGTLPFHKDGNNEYVIYIPEYKNQNSTSKSSMTVSVSTKGGESIKLKDPTISFKDYAGGADLDIIRNHYYKFNIVKVGNNDLTLGIEYQVMEWEGNSRMDITFN